ncbi:MAG: hypothetical protein GC136_08970 [Alphaproteobacteria bacterium]|nr:hypothetical protein [Alphaproteobacteria bacterium]
MKLTLAEIMDKLGVGYELEPYALQPWDVYDEVKGVTAHAEVRMEGNGQEFITEVLLMPDEPSAENPPVQQIMRQRGAIQHSKWTILELKIKGKEEDNKVYNWEEKSCNLFRMIVLALKQNKIPDFDELIEDEMRSRERFGDQHGGGSSKSPKIRPAQLLDMKQGKGF